MNTGLLVRKWFDLLENDDFNRLPITENFSLTGLFGTIEGATTFLTLVEENKNKFLGPAFQLNEGISSKTVAWVKLKPTTTFLLQVHSQFHNLFQHSLHQRP